MLSKDIPTKESLQAVSRATIYEAAENIVIVEKRQRLPLSSDFYIDINSRNQRTTAIVTTLCLERQSPQRSYGSLAATNQRKFPHPPKKYRSYAMLCSLL